MTPRPPYARPLQTATARAARCAAHVASAIVLALLAACSQTETARPEEPGCAKDSDCKGDRICSEGACREPSGSSAGASAAAQAAAAGGASASSIATTTLAPDAIGLTVSASGGASPAPDVKAWAAANALVFPAARAAGCEAKVVRDWLRLSCRTDASDPNDVRNVRVGKGCPAGGTFTLARAYPAYSLASVVARMAPGMACAVTFEWARSARELSIDWAVGGAQPTARLAEATSVAGAAAMRGCSPSDRDTGCAATLYVQLMTVGAAVPDTYDYPEVRALFDGHPDLAGVRVVEGNRQGRRIVAAVVRSRCQADKLTAIAQEALKTGAGSRCEPLDVRRQVWVAQ